MASGYSPDTQSIWNGIIGKIELRCENIFHTSNIQVFPDKESVHIKLTAHSDCAKPNDRRKVKFRICAVSPTGKELKEKNIMLFFITANKSFILTTQLKNLFYGMNLILHFIH